MGNYLYNGIKLPDINTVWTDKTTYPYAYITASTSPRRLILTATNKKVMRTNGTCMVTATSSYDNYTVYELTDGEWVSGTYSGSFIAVWCSEDLYYSSVLSDDTDSDLAGTLYLAASDPIPATSAPAPDPFWLTMGWLVGRAIAGLRGKKETAEPVAYLYNGVRLPKLPEWDKTVYPYALMYYGATTIVVLCYSKYPMTTDGSKNSGTVRFASGIVVVDQYSINASSETEWNAYGESEGTGTYGGSHKQLIWANHDIFDYDDSSYLHLAASEPVPVYE